MILINIFSAAFILSTAMLVSYFMSRFNIYVFISTFIVSLVVFALLNNMFIYRHANNIDRLNDIIGKLAEGNLIEAQDLVAKSKMGYISNNLGNLVQYISSTFSGINELIRLIKVQNEDINATVQQFNEEILNTFNELSAIDKESSQITNSMKNIAAVIEETTKDTYNVSMECNEANAKSAETVNWAVAGAKALREADEAMQNVVGSIREVSNSINKLDESSKRISDIVSVISAISDQTNLLALNAAIEAARAGEYGRGFSVVAEEIRKLAEQSNISAKEIKEIIDLTLTNTQHVVDSITEGNEFIEEGQKKFRILSKYFDNIVKNSQIVAESVDNISLATEAQTSQVEAVNMNVTEIVHLIDLADSGVKVAVASFQKHSNMISQLNSSIERLYNKVNELDNIFGKIKC